jgi:hypothetical protein
MRPTRVDRPGFVSFTAFNMPDTNGSKSCMRFERALTNQGLLPREAAAKSGVELNPTGNVEDLEFQSAGVGSRRGIESVLDFR